MVYIIDKKTTKKELELLFPKKRGKKTKGFDAKKFCGILKLKMSPLAIQKKLRNEWD